MIRKTLIRSQVVILLALLITTGGCGEQNQRSGQDKPQVFVSIPPLEYFTKRIAAQHLTVSVLIAPGGNPHTFTPTPKQIVKLSRGGLLLCAGSDFEQTLSSKLRWDDQLKVVNLAGRSDNHDHDSDIHTWMSPRIAKTLAEKICVELCDLDPANSEDYRRNLRELQDDLDTLDATVTKTLKGLKGKTFFVFHPALGHFAEAYGLKQRAIEREGKAPGPKYRSELIASARAIGAKALFVQPQFSRRSADIIAKEIGCPVVVLDPLSGDYINNLEHIAEELQKALQP